MGQRQVDRLVEEIRHLPEAAQDRIADELIDSRMNRVVRRLRRNVRTRRISTKEIERIVAKARRDFHDARRP